MPVSAVDSAKHAILTKDVYKLVKETKEPDTLYEAALAIIKDSSKQYKISHQSRDMKNMVRAYEILRLIKRQPSKGFFAFFHNLKSDYFHNNALKSSEKTFVSNFTDFVKARAKTLHEHAELESKLNKHVDKIEISLKELEIDPSLWKDLKQALAEDNEPSAKRLWNVILAKVRTKTPFFHSQKTVEEFLFDTLPIPQVIKHPGDPFTAKVIALSHQFEKLAHDKPEEYKDKWHKVQVALLTQDMKSLKYHLKAFERIPAIKTLLHATTPKTPDNIQSSSSILRDSSIRNVLQRRTDFESSGTAVDTVALDHKTYVVGKTPHNGEINAYFNKLEYHGAKVIVDFQGDYEAGEQYWLPTKKGETKKYGDHTSVTLKESKPISTPPKPPYEHKDLFSIVQSTIEVERNGKKETYQLLRMPYWEKGAPIHPDALKQLSQAVVKAEHQTGGKMAVSSTDGASQPSAFVIYHHHATSKKHHDPIQTLYQYKQFKPTMENPAELGGVIDAVNHKKIHSEQLNAKTIRKTLAEKLLIKHDGLHQLGTALGQDHIQKQTKIQSKLAYFFGNSNVLVQQLLAIEIAKFGPEALNRFFYLLDEGFNLSDLKQILNDQKINPNVTSVISFLRDKKAFLTQFPESNGYDPVYNVLREDPPPVEPIKDLHILTKLAKYKSLKSVRKKLANAILEKNSARINHSSQLIEKLFNSKEGAWKQLGGALIKAINPKNIPHIPAKALTTFSKQQLRALRPEQAAKLTLEQWHALSSNELKHLSPDVFVHLPKELATAENLLKADLSNAYAYLRQNGLVDKEAEKLLDMLIEPNFQNNHSKRKFYNEVCQLTALALPFAQSKVHTVETQAKQINKKKVPVLQGLTQMIGSVLVLEKILRTYEPLKNVDGMLAATREKGILKILTDTILDHYDKIAPDEGALKHLQKLENKVNKRLRTTENKKDLQEIENLILAIKTALQTAAGKRASEPAEGFAEAR